MFNSIRKLLIGDKNMQERHRPPVPIGTIKKVASDIGPTTPEKLVGSVFEMRGQQPAVCISMTIGDRTELVLVSLAKYFAARYMSATPDESDVYVVKALKPDGLILAAHGTRETIRANYMRWSDLGDESRNYIALVDGPQPDPNAYVNMLADDMRRQVVEKFPLGNVVDKDLEQHQIADSIVYGHYIDFEQKGPNLEPSLGKVIEDGSLVIISSSIVPYMREFIPNLPEFLSPMGQWKHELVR